MYFVYWHRSFIVDRRNHKACRRNHFAISLSAALLFISPRFSLSARQSAVIYTLLSGQAVVKYYDFIARTAPGMRRRVGSYHHSPTE